MLIETNASGHGNILLTETNTIGHGNILLTNTSGHGNILLTETNSSGHGNILLTNASGHGSILLTETNTSGRRTSGFCCRRCCCAGSNFQMSRPSSACQHSAVSRMCGNILLTDTKYGGHGSNLLTETNTSGLCNFLLDIESAGVNAERKAADLPGFFVPGCGNNCSLSAAQMVTEHV